MFAGEPIAVQERVNRSGAWYLPTAEKRKHARRGFPPPQLFGTRRIKPWSSGSETDCCICIARLHVENSLDECVVCESMNGHSTALRISIGILSGISQSNRYFVQEEQRLPYTRSIYNSL